IARLVEVTHVAREVPSVAERLGVRVRALPVAGERFVGVEVGDDLTFLARGHGLVGAHAPLHARLDHTQLRMDARAPRAARPGVGRGADRERVDLGGGRVVKEKDRTEGVRAGLGEVSQTGWY